MTAQDLKNAILQLAIQGKLVPQDPKDGSASELLEHIISEKEKLIKNGKLTIDKKHTADSITEDDIPYELPDNWCWTKLADIVFFYSGKTPERQTTSNWDNGQYAWISISDMIPNSITTETKEKISQSALNDYFSGRLTPAGTMIMSFKLTIGKISILGVDAVHNEAIISIFPFINDNELKEYLFSVLPLIANSGNTKNAVKGKTLNATSLSNLMIPLQPLAEQKRIIAKIEELMPLVEEYGKLEEQRTALDAEFPEKLRKSILQQAIQGKLTERDPADEPASKLLKRIHAEKERFIKEGNGRKEKQFPQIAEDELPFEIPNGWAVIRIGDVGIYKKGPFGSSLTKSMFVPKGAEAVKVYEQKNAIQKDYKLGSYYIRRSYFEEKMRGFEVFPGDIIVSCAGTIGETYVLPEGIEQGIINQALMRMKIVPSVNIDYFLLYFDYVLKKSAQGSSKCSAIKNIPPFDVFKRMVLPLPPLAEQQRIVERVNELLALCDELKMR